MRVPSLARPLLLFLALAVHTSGAALAGTLINFDSIQTFGTGTLNPDGTFTFSPPPDWTAAFASQGMMFDRNPTIANYSLGPVVTAPSGPNRLSVHGSISITFVDPTDSTRAATTDFFSFDDAGVGPVSLMQYSGLEVVAYNIDGQVIGRTYIDPLGQFNGGHPAFTSSIAAAGIHKITFTWIAPDRAQVPSLDGFQGYADHGVDNFYFGNLTVVPEPSTLALACVAFFGLVAAAWRNSRSRSPA
jgi:hypothetical protein